MIGAKLRAPLLRIGWVERQRLTAQLDVGLRARLILLCAPAGSGKSTLLGDWVHKAAGRGIPSAWLTLDEGDNDPARFFAYLASAADDLAAGVGDHVRTLLTAPHLQSAEALVAGLLTGLQPLKADCLLVLDDFHVIHSPQVEEAMRLLVEHLPPWLHLVIASRSEPALPLARLRVRGELLEVRAGALCFTPQEAAAFLRERMGLHLSEEQVAVLASRTEGWAAGLQLAGLSLQGCADPAGFVAQFAGSHRHVLDYLAEEVLQRQEADTQAFLLQTAVLDRLCGPLCDALTGREDGQAMLERLERANLLVVPLDEERRWYRYHHLFAEFLRVQLARVYPMRAAALHGAAAGWYAAAGLLAEAIPHALAAGDWAEAAGLLARVSRGLLQAGEAATLQGWLGALPAEVAAQPALLVAHGWCLLMAGRLAEAADLLAPLHGPDDGFEAAGVLADAGPLRGEVAAILATAASVTMDTARTISLAEEALALLPAQEQFVRSIVGLSLGSALMIGGRLDRAEGALLEAVAGAAGAGSLFLRLMLRASLAQVYEWQGRLQVAAALYAEVLALAGPEESAPVGALAYARVGLGGILHAQGDLGGGEQMLRDGLRQAQCWGSTEVVLGAYQSLIKLYLSAGRPAEAEACVAQARPLVRSLGQGATLLEALAARVALAQGDGAAATRWAEETMGVHAAHPALVQEQLQLVQARVFLAAGQPASALALLQAAQASADAAGRVSSLIEVLLLTARAAAALGDGRGAQAALVRARELAMPAGFVQLLRDEVPQATPPLAEPLTERELEVLQLTAAGLANTEIAQRLFITEGTVKVHLNRIFGKLAVRNRTQAAARARELRLL